MPTTRSVLDTHWAKRRGLKQLRALALALPLVCLQIASAEPLHNRAAPCRVGNDAAIDADHGARPSWHPVPAGQFSVSAGANAFHIDDGTGVGLVESLVRLHERRVTLSPQLARQALAAFGIERSPLTIARQAPAALDATPAGRQIDQASRHLLTLLAQGLLLPEVSTLWKLEIAEIERRIWRMVRLLHVRSRELLIA